MNCEWEVITVFFLGKKHFLLGNNDKKKKTTGGYTLIGFPKEKNAPKFQFHQNFIRILNTFFFEDRRNFKKKIWILRLMSLIIL